MKAWKKFCTFLLIPSFISVASASAEPIEISFQNTYPPQQRQTLDIVQPWAESFEEKTNGEIIMNYYNSSAVVEITELPHAVRNGMLDMAMISPVFPQETPYSFLLGMPYLSKSIRQASKVWKALMDEFPELKAEMEQYGKVLSVHSSAPMGIISKNPVRSLADMKGKRVLVVVGNLAEIVESFGGIPVLVNMGDVYVGLQRGMGEMNLSGLSNLKGLRLHEVAKNLIVLDHPYNGPLFTIINHDTYNSMDDKQKKMMEELTAPLGQNILQSFYEDKLDTIQFFKDNGVDVFEPTQEELQPFVEASKSILYTTWARKAKEYGIKGDVDAIINRYYEIADAIPYEE